MIFENNIASNIFINIFIDRQYISQTFDNIINPKHQFSLKYCILYHVGRV